MASLFLWWFVVLLLGWAAAPTAFVLFKHLPDKGFGFSKILALLLMGYLSWILGYVSFGAPMVLFAFLLMAFLSFFLLWGGIHKAFLEHVKKNAGYFLLVECFFFMAFLVAGVYKMRTHDIAGAGEKPMDFAFLNGILASTTMPPQDPWLSGGSISYYYFGYFIVAMLTKITGVPSGEAFNLAIALFWALAALGAFSLGYALTRRYRYSLFSAACAVILGNLDYWHRAVQSFKIGDLTIPYYDHPVNPGTVTGIRAMVDYLWSPLQHGWDYFQASRIIVPPVEKMINEFPAFSFFLSDLHPHLMAIPFVLLSLAMAFNLLKSPLPGLRAFGGGGLGQILQIFLYAVVFGGLSFLNSWDFPTFTFLLGVCLFLQQWWVNEEGGKTWFKSVLITGLPIVIPAFLLYLPFYVRLQSQAQGLGIALKDRTSLYHLAVIFGLFLVVLVPALVGKAMRPNAEKNTRPKSKRLDGPACEICGREGAANKKFCGSCGGQLALSADSEIVPLPEESLRETLARPLSWVTGMGSLRRWTVLAGVVILLALFDFLPAKLAVFFLALTLLFFSAVSLSGKSENKEMVFSTLTVILGVGLVAWCEIFYVRDLFGGNLYRMNTVFKFHYQVWILFSVASGPFLKWLFENQWPKWVSWKKGLWALTASFALLGSSLYPVLAFNARMRDTANSPSTMDGAAYYEHFLTVDYQAAQWIKESIKPSPGGKLPLILEAWGDSYHQETAKLATLTGYPTILGWAWHEVQWRGSSDNPVIRGGSPDDTIKRREEEVDLIYSSVDLEVVRGLLKKYGVGYVYLGEAERKKYGSHPDGLGKFPSLGNVVWQSGNVILYKVGS